MTATHPPPRRRGHAVLGLIARLKRIIRTHENYSVRLVIGTHVIMVALDLIDRATYQTVHAFYLLRVWADSPVWIALGCGLILWLVFFSRPPRIIWGLWASTAVLSGWGLVNLLIGLYAEPPVSLLGPALILFIAAPLAWTTADAFQERMQQESHDTVSEGSRARSGG